MYFSCNAIKQFLEVTPLTLIFKNKLLLPFFLFLRNLFCSIITINFVFSLSKADAMAEKIGYAPFILNNTALDKTYDAVCCETKI